MRNVGFWMLNVGCWMKKVNENKDNLIIAKVSISSKEARESKYWLMLLKDSGYIDPTKQKVKKLFEEIESIIKILTSIVKTGQENA